MSDSPEPVKDAPWLNVLGTVAQYALVVGGAAFVLMSVTVSRTSGAIRSARLQWKSREQHMDEVMAVPPAESCPETIDDESPARR